MTIAGATLGSSVPALATWSPSVPPLDTMPAAEDSGAGDATKADAPPVPAQGQTTTAPPPDAPPLVPIPQPETAEPVGAGTEAARETYIPLPARPAGLGPRRSKALKMTVGVPPTTGDLGSESDTLTPTTGPSPDENVGQIRLNDTWSFVLKGYLRAPMRVGFGARDDGAPGNEWHSPPRMVGMSSSNWAYINVAPNPTGSLRASISNERVTGTLIISTNTYSGVGYPDLDSQGGMAQGYVTLKFPDAFGMRGGLAWTLGAFSNRYGYAGHRQVNSGYYGVYLFGRTRTVGETLTANIDLTDHVELLIEHGVGAELETLPILGANLPKQMFIPGDPHDQLGSDFVMHGHVSLWIDEWLKIGTHYLTSWTPKDNSLTPGSSDAQLSVVGGEIHLDHPRWGNGFIGYSHVWATISWR